MTKEQALTLMGVIHGHWPMLGLQRKGEWNEKANDWIKYLQPLDYEAAGAVIRDYFCGLLVFVAREHGPSFASIAQEVRRRTGARQPESSHEACAEFVRLKDFKDGDYVGLNPPHFPCTDSEILPGGRVEKRDAGDLISDIPMKVDWVDCKGYHLMSYAVTDPADLKHIKLMNDTQREAWIRHMEKLDAQGQFIKFSKPRAHDRGEDPKALKELF